MQALPWRESASLILASGTSALKLLWLQRSGGLWAKSRVFAGGVVDACDFSPRWEDCFAKNAASFDSLILPSNANRPPILQSRPGELPREIALRITALRETFEESGILIAEPKSKIQQLTSELAEWRKSVTNDSTKFLDMCEQLHIYPDVEALKLWSDWLTPTDLPIKRFDTVFFVAEGDEGVDIDVNEKEMLNSRWMSPGEALVAMASGEITLPPPQMYECTRLMRFKSAKELVEFAERRQHFGAILYLPVRIRCADGIVTLFPGDDAYPSNPDLYKPLPPDDRTVTELRKDVKNLHRLESDHKDTVVDFHMNISLDPEHCAPVNLFRKLESLGVHGFSGTPRLKPQTS
ncbi:acyl-coenzyme A diphosphatase NUDT19-like [Paramacrobiotus metropolitanus]|uniref:acyl-coenzyme A diphosphatase NUDT19-like n=1 Tax=Paramacrobiotus metropolitanus TaxID=2943436 RepID=UPI0024465399|nr:acyl-coenzyme A diphosphatase NUDT19-like [Paramacrobiotus metropolitanus]